MRQPEHLPRESDRRSDRPPRELLAMVSVVQRTWQRTRAPPSRRRRGPAWRASHAGHVSLGQLKVMSAIERCRTAPLGGRVERCEACAHLRISYNSCRNRHCPKCQAAAAKEWLIAADPKHLGARIGLTAVLHTWGSALTHHPHAHIIVPGAAASRSSLPRRRPGASIGSPADPASSCPSGCSHASSAACSWKG